MEKIYKINTKQKKKTFLKGVLQHSPCFDTRTDPACIFGTPDLFFVCKRKMVKRCFKTTVICLLMVYSDQNLL